MQLSNAELLNLVRDGNKDPQSKQENSLETKNNDAQSQQLPDLQSEILESPLTHPRLVNARNRYKAPKSSPGKDKSSFQSRLLKNPYAHALATPPRHCLLTNVRMPNYFMIPFGLELHPKTGAPWHLPRLPAGPSHRLSSDGDLENKANDTASSLPRVSAAAQAETPVTAGRQLTRSMTGTYFLASQDVLRHVSRLKAGPYQKLIPFRWKEDSSVKSANIVWREDMDVVVLETLRDNISGRLAYLASSRAAYICSCEDHRQISNHTQVGAVLWLGPKRRDSVQMNDPSTDGAPADDFEELSPPPYAMHYYKNHYIPVYNLLSLIGPTKVATLRESSSAHFGDQYAVIKMKRLTVEVQLELWKLLGYLEQGKTEKKDSRRAPDHAEVDRNGKPR